MAAVGRMFSRVARFRAAPFAAYDAERGALVRTCVS